MVRGFEVMGKEVKEGSWELLWCSLRVLAGCFAGRLEHTSALGWYFLVPLLLLLPENLGSKLCQDTVDANLGFVLLLCSFLPLCCLGV